MDSSWLMRAYLIRFGHGESLYQSRHEVNEAVERRVHVSRRRQKTTGRIIFKIQVPQKSEKSRHGFNYHLRSQHEKSFYRDQALGICVYFIMGLVPI